MGKYKQVPISPKVLLEIFNGGTYEINNSGLPKDFKLINWYLAPERHSLMFVVESEEFDDLAEGSIIPEYEGDILIKKLK